MDYNYVCNHNKILVQINCDIKILHNVQFNTIYISA